MAQVMHYKPCRCRCTALTLTSQWKQALAS